MSQLREILGTYGMQLEAGTIPGTDYRTDGHLRRCEHVILLPVERVRLGRRD
jgi:hypothetical protein